MATYLLKTEPGDYSIDDLERDTTTIWDGVTNPQACLIMRGVAKGDEAFIYHTGSDKAIVGLAKITSKAYADPKDGSLTAKGEIKFPVFDIRYAKRAKAPLTLAGIKADKRFADFALVKQSRLSAMEVASKLDKLIRELAGL